MRSATTMRTALQAILGIAMLGGVAAALFWAVMSFNNNDNDPLHPILSGTSIPAPTADDPQPAQPTPPPTVAAPTREVAAALPTAANLPASAPTAIPTVAPPTEASLPPASDSEPAVEPTASGPTPTPRVLRAPPAQPTATQAATDGIAAEVVPTGSSDQVQTARSFPTPAPLVDAAPPTAAPSRGVIEEAVPTAPTGGARQTPTPVGGRPAVVPAIVPLQNGPANARDIVMPNVPTVVVPAVVPAIEPEQVVPTIVAVDRNPTSTKPGRKSNDPPRSVLPGGAIVPRVTRTPTAPGAQGARPGVPGIVNPGKGPGKKPNQKNNGHSNNGNGNKNGNDKDKNKKNNS